MAKLTSTRERKGRLSDRHARMEKERKAYIDKWRSGTPSKGVWVGCICRLAGHLVKAGYMETHFGFCPFCLQAFGWDTWTPAYQYWLEGPATPDSVVTGDRGTR